MDTEENMSIADIGMPIHIWVIDQSHIKQNDVLVIDIVLPNH